MVHQETFSLTTRGRTTINITERVQQVVQNAGMDVGLCQVFTQHTSCSLMLCENADPDVRRDLETWMAKTVVDGDPDFVHTLEGPDDMSAHIRTLLTNPNLTIPVRDGRCALGTWQGVFLWEHRTHPQHRQVIVTVLG